MEMGEAVEVMGVDVEEIKIRVRFFLLNHYFVVISLHSCALLFSKNTLHLSFHNIDIATKCIKDCFKIEA